MKKRVNINNNSIKNIIKRNLTDGATLSEDKIDSIIREYLTEREEFVGKDEPLGNKYFMSPKSSEAIEDMIDGLDEMVNDLNIIKEKESDVLVETDHYVDEYLTSVVEMLEDIIDNLIHLDDVTKNKDEDNIEL